MTHLYLGIDVGTSGVRCAIVDAKGHRLVLAQQSFPHTAEQQADPEVWWQAVVACLDELGDALSDKRLSFDAVQGLAVDGTSGTVVLVDANVRPVTPALMYFSQGFETEGAAIAKASPVNSITRGHNSALARVLHLQSLDKAQRAKHLCHQADFIAAKFLGRAGFSDDNNALKTGFDPETLMWPLWMAKAGAMMRLFPKVARIGTKIGKISPEMQRRFGFSPNVSIHAGTTDSIAAFLATGASHIGDAVTSLGTTLAIKLLSNQRIESVEHGVYSHRLNKLWLVGGASNTGGGVLLSFFDKVQLQALSHKLNPAVSSGLDYYPLTRPGERFPHSDPNFLPRLMPRPLDDAIFLQGLLEGMSNIEKHGYDLLEAMGAPKLKRLFTAGGGARNEAWTEIRKQRIAASFEPSLETEAACGVATLCFKQP